MSPKTQRFQLRAEVLRERLGVQWATFSAASGQTQLLNDEAAAILEVLAGSPLSLTGVAGVLASENGLDFHTIMPLLDDAVIELEAAGLIRRVQPSERPFEDSDCHSD